MTGTLREEEWQEDQVAADDAQHIEIDTALPSLERDGFHRSDGEDAHVVHDEINSAEVL